MCFFHACSDSLPIFIYALSFLIVESSNNFLMHDKLAGRKKGISENSEMSRKYNSMGKQTLEPVFFLGIFVNT